MRGFFRLLEVLALSTRAKYISYYADVQYEFYTLFTKYESVG